MKLLVTGATGFLGSEVLPRLLERGHTVYALSREQRRSDNKNLVYIQGSITRCLPKIPALDAVLHMAALTSLRERDKSKMFRTNTLAAEHMAFYCASRQIPLFHVSTLYVCGDHKGLFTERDLNVKQGFKNLYEESKYEAERSLRANPDLQLTVFRPGILIGRYSDGHAASFGGFYRPLGAIIACHRFFERDLGFPPRERFEDALHIPRLNLPIKITGDPNSLTALTPIDWAAKSIVENLNPGSIGRTFHLVPQRQPRMRELVLAIRSALNISGIEVVEHARKDPLSLMYNRLVRDFTPYTRSQPTFTTSLGNCPFVNQSYLERVVAYWRKHSDPRNEDIREHQGHRRADAFGRDDHEAAGVSARAV